MEGPCLKSTMSGASAVDAGRLFQRRIVLGKKLQLKQSQEVKIFPNLFEWLARFLCRCRYKVQFIVDVYYVVEHGQLRLAPSVTQVFPAVGCLACLWQSW